MSAGTRGIRGSAQEERVTPESFAPERRAYRLPAATRLGAVRLQVTDLERSVAFYTEVIGLRVVESADGRTGLGAPGAERVLVWLEQHRTGVALERRPRLGLFHFALLVPDRAALGRFAHHMLNVGLPLNAGDHLVSEALYLHDPDGLGIEVYADRPRNEWQRDGRELRIATEPLDIADLLAAPGKESWEGMPRGTVVGHVHLRVGDLRQAAAFFSDGLGFDVMTWSYPGALFLGAGGYHHHLGTNVWARGAQPPETGEPRLLEWTIEVPDAISVDEAEGSLAVAGYPTMREQDEITTMDPWGTVIRIRRTHE